jgi:aryl-alcohol dehydrogenase-like predicted oxidoreductase
MTKKKMSKSQILKTTMLIAKHNGTTLQQIARKYGISRAIVQSSILNFSELSETKQNALAESLKVDKRVLSEISAGKMDFLDYLRLSN